MATFSGWKQHITRCVMWKISRSFNLLYGVQRIMLDVPKKLSSNASLENE